jgi:para-aminobenzoate synthetase/4-amino-4-deoxychorismate lyase
MSPERADAPDRALGVFETLLVRDGQAQALSAHLRRLAVSVSELYGLELPPDLPSAIHRRIERLEGEHRLRVDAVPDGAVVRVQLRCSRLEATPALAPLICRPVPIPGGLGAHKWADRRWLDQLAQPGSVALLLDLDGEILEAAWGNFWLLEQGRLITPPADGRLLPGVTRARLLALAPSLGLTAGEEQITLERARAAGGMLLTSSVRLAVAAALEPAEPGGDERSVDLSADERLVLPAIHQALSSASWGQGED